MEYKKICLEVAELAAQVGAFVKNERVGLQTKGFETKGKNDFVTYIDKESEKRVIEGLEKILPDSGFIAEEQTSVKKNETYNWIIDPIDGTTNFIHGLPPHAISIALQKNDELVIGVVHEIVLGETFYAWQNGGAYINGKSIHVSNVPKVHDSLIATGFPYSDFSRMQNYVETMMYFFSNSHGLRRIGSAATDLAYVACGRFDAFYEYSLKPWDVAAGVVIVREAGGRIGDFSGKNNFLFGGEIIASNNNVFDEMQEIIGSRMNS